MERSPVPMAELEGAGHIVRYVNTAFCRLTAKPKEALVGKPFAEAMQEGDTCLAALDRVYGTGKGETHTESEHADPHPAYWSYAMWPVVDAQQRPVGVMMQVTETTLFHQHAGAMNEALLVSSVHQHEQTERAEALNEQLRTEIGERKRVEGELSDSEKRYRSLVEQVKDYAIFSTDIAGRATSWNEGVKRILGFNEADFIGQDIAPAIFTPEDFAAGVPDRELRTAAAEGSASDDRWLQRKDGSRFFAQGVTTALRDPSGTLIGFSKIFRDTTGEKDAEQRQQLLLNELAHRGKNLLGLIQTLVSRSLSGNRSLAEAREALIARIQALARSQTMLVHAAFEGAPLAEIVRLQFEGFSDRVETRGSDVTLNPRAAQTFALLLHELATNATKYGALSQPGGKIAIDWSIEGAAPEARFRLRWLERGGPPVTPPSHQGFGRTLIEKAAAHEFGAPPRINYAPEGLSYEIEAPLSAVAAGGGRMATIERPGRDMSDEERGSGARDH